MNERRMVTIAGWLAIGVGMGVALGVAMDNFTLWIPIGIALGLIIGAASGSRREEGS